MKQSELNKLMFKLVKVNLPEYSPWYKKLWDKIFCVGDPAKCASCVNNKNNLK